MREPFTFNMAPAFGELIQEQCGKARIPISALRQQMKVVRIDSRRNAKGRKSGGARTGDPQPALLATVQTPEYTDSQIQYGKAYVYSVQAFVASGNSEAESDASESISIAPEGRFPPTVPEGLAAILSRYFKLPVRIEQHVPHWMRFAREDRSRLGFGARWACPTRACKPAPAITSTSAGVSLASTGQPHAIASSTVRLVVSVRLGCT